MVTDVIMPGMSGLELADRLAKKKPGIHVLFISGYTEDVMERRGSLRPGEAFLAKPFTHDSLARKVRELLDQGHRTKAPVKSRQR
jgi:FixJ family two-component response regulator